METQTEIPGTEAPKILEIEKAAESYIEARDTRMGHTKREVAAKAVLIQAMHNHGLTNYAYSDREVTLSPVEKVKVKTNYDNAGGDE